MQVECRTLTNKLNLMEKEFTRYKAQSKEEIDRNEKTMEEMEGKISEVRVVQLRSMDVHFRQCDFS